LGLPCTSRDAVLDEGPLVDAAGRLHDQAVGREEEALVDDAVAALEAAGALEELEARVLPEEEVVDLLLHLALEAVLEVFLVDEARSEQAVDHGVPHVARMVPSLAHRLAVQMSGAHHVGEHAVEQQVLVVVESDTAIVEVQRLPRVGTLDAQHPDLLVEGEHLEDLSQIDARQITFQRHGFLPRTWSSTSAERTVAIDAAR
jgi:hypothetical protein